MELTVNVPDATVDLLEQFLPDGMEREEWAALQLEQAVYNQRVQQAQQASQQRMAVRQQAQTQQMPIDELDLDNPTEDDAE